MNQLDDFLKDQETGLFDSSGEFTIAADKALEKLAHNQLPHPSYWVLKLVQCASVMGAEEMTFKIGRRVCSVQMPLPRPIEIQELQRGLGAVRDLEDPALTHLVTGLRALGGVDGRRFVLELVTAEQREYLFWKGEKLYTKREESGSSTPHLKLEVTGSNPQLWQRLVDVVSLENRAEEARLLSFRAFTAPFKLFVDGRRPHFFGFEKPDCFDLPLLWDYAEDGDGFTLPSVIRARIDESVVGAARERLKERVREMPRASAFWTLNYHYRLSHKRFRVSPEPEPLVCSNYLHWLRDGVVVRSEPFDGRMLGFCVELFVDARDCPTDLGGLNLRESDAFSRKRDWVGNLLLQVRSSAEAQIREATGITGRVMGGWDALVFGLKHMPLDTNVIYPGPNRVGGSLNAHPEFRKKLLKLLKDQPLDIHRLKCAR